MGDADLEEIRRARLQQLQQEQGGQGGQKSGEDQQKKRESEARAHILNQILTPGAADRLGRIRLVKESRATDVENRLIMLAQSGQLRQQVTENQLKDILNALSEQQAKEGEQKVVVSRRKGWDDDDDDLLDL